jgi:hypothetical protein
MLTLSEVLIAIAFYVIFNALLSVYIWDRIFTYLRDIRDMRNQRKRYPRFYGKKPLPPIATNSNVLDIFHGRKEGLHNEVFIAYSTEYTYTLDKDSSKDPDFCWDARELKQFHTELSDACFDKILVNNCICCTGDIAKFQGQEFIKCLTRLLKPRGKLYIKDYRLYTKGLNPISVEFLNELGLRGYNGITLRETIAGNGWLLLCKEPSLPMLKEEEKKAELEYVRYIGNDTC